MKKYESYKPLSELWLSSIPIHWHSRKIKYLFSERSEKGYPDEQLLVASQNMGVVPKHIYGNRTVEAMKDLHLLKLVRVGDFVISLRSFQGGIEYAYYQGIISPAYTIMIPKDIIMPSYFRYLAKSRLFIELLQLCVTGIREGQNIDYNKLKNHQIPVPPRLEQDQIVRYLDWKVSKINKLIAVKKKEISRIAELKKTVVNEAVTHGLNPNVPMKFSGVDWLGDIPAHWKTTKLRQILHPFSEKNHPELPLLSVVREQGVIVRNVEDKESNHNFIPDDLSGYKMVKKGQLAMNKMKAWQGSYGISDYTGIISPAYYVFDVDFENLEYFHYAIRSKVYVNFFAQASDGIRVGQWDLSIPKMKEIPFIVPPENEQKAIVEYIPKACAKYDAAIAQLTQEVDLLEEYRTKLISDVVTGQIDVRGIEIPEYEYVEEEADEESDETDGTDEEAEEQEE
ncbi:restriction endonuclease subunit S [Caproiciproducens galactitolivorans]|uniref:EcoKI restriction-modification system protein HsdS n=1 Tax=Caproiciproducens galactitolivorans TaxID=642589 RepID=A0A4Z0YDA1_9FIRM|nr:restriction endonuclease subunit S [Caproiciproducens galactitolivorans]QEY35513.1 restriction endonuclease subunit S [Caproiciproducens galactitolivorans]TGJ77231.1 EcoKI restriction-modification system protein HsdS [Caproiciproducens galactitolivorans]